MAENYCGKDCTACAHKEALNCPGCQAGPGRPGIGDCALAKCCRKKGHGACVTCSFSVNCGMLRDKHRVPEYRLKRIETEKRQQEAIAKRAPFLGKWLWLLFWLFIPSDIASLMSNENITAIVPALQLPGMVLNVVCAVIYGVALLRLSTQEDRYRTAGICTLASSAVGVLLSLIPLEKDLAVWALLLSIPTLVISLVGQYNEFIAHATVLTGADNILGQKWSTLWKWYIGMYGALFGSLALMLLIPILGLLVLLAAAIGIGIVSIVKLVYLYRTAKTFREYSVTVM